MKRTKIGKRFYGTIAIALLLVSSFLITFYVFVKQQSLDHSLTVAVANNRASDVLKLLEAGADPNTPQSAPDLSPKTFFRVLLRHLRSNRPIRSTTLLHKAAAWRRPDKNKELKQEFSERHESAIIIEALLNHGAKVNAQDEIGATPMTLAVSYRKTEAVWSLVMHHANIDLQDDRGFCVSQWLCIVGWEYPVLGGGGRSEMRNLIDTAQHAPPGTKMPAQFLPHEWTL